MCTPRYLTAAFTMMESVRAVSRTGLKRICLEAVPLSSVVSTREATPASLTSFANSVSVGETMAKLTTYECTALSALVSECSTRTDNGGETFFVLSRSDYSRLSRPLSAKTVSGRSVTNSV